MKKTTVSKTEIGEVQMTFRVEQHINRIVDGAVLTFTLVRDLLSRRTILYTGKRWKLGEKLTFTLTARDMGE